jgi:hypothetical protein
LYPKIDQRYFASILSHVQAQIEIVNRQLQSDPKTVKAKNIEDIASSVFPKDDSSLQWGESGSGVTSDPRAALTKLFDRLVAKYEEPVSEVTALNVRRDAAIEQNLLAATAKLDAMARSIEKLEKRSEMTITVLAAIQQYISNIPVSSYALMGNRPQQPHAAYMSRGNEMWSSVNTLGMGSTGNETFAARSFTGFRNFDVDLVDLSFIKRLEGEYGNR